MNELIQWLRDYVKEQAYYDPDNVLYHKKIADAADALEQAEQDAARYRWLRQNRTIDTPCYESPEELDATIDAAMQDARKDALRKLTENAEELGLYGDEKSV